MFLLCSKCGTLPRNVVALQLLQLPFLWPLCENLFSSQMLFHLHPLMSCLLPDHCSPGGDLLDGQVPEKQGHLWVRFPRAAIHGVVMNFRMTVLMILQKLVLLL